MATQESFLKDIENHVMTVIRDDGDVNRHIRFAAPGSSCMQFDLITWPGYLCYTGDMGTYVFRRTHDMLKFFWSDKLTINTDYWAEKIEAQDRCDGVKEFNEDIFVETVMGYLKEFIKDSHKETTKKERRKLWDAVIDEVINADGDSGGHRKQCAAMDFRHKVNNYLEFSFQDFWEHDLTAYTHRYLWCCYALSWAAKAYFDSLPPVDNEITW